MTLSMKIAFQQLPEMNRELRLYLPHKPVIHDRTEARALEGMLYRVKLARPPPADRNRLTPNVFTPVFLEIHADYVTFLFEKIFLRKECKEHSIVCISALMIINKIVLVFH